MLDLKFVRENLDKVKAGLNKKHFTKVNIDFVLKQDDKRRDLIKAVDRIRAVKNKASGEIPRLEDKHKKKKIEEMQSFSEQEEKLNAQLTELEKELQELVEQIPNIPLDSVPEGEGEQDNKGIKTVGEKPSFDFEPKDHVKLGESLDLIDIQSAARISGSRFCYLKNEAVRLEFALAQFIIEKLTHRGFTPIVPPVLVKEHAMYGTGFFPADRNEIYHVNQSDDDLYLVGTAEVSLNMMHSEQILDLNKLPLHYIGFSTCFRREAGSWGKDTRGIIRVHQFDKLEMFSFCHPDKSYEEHELLLSLEEEIMKDIGFHYRIINICGGDLGSPAAKKYDIEVWMPTQNTFRELTSCSNCTDYQARRSKIRYKDKDGNNKFVHTLNGTACAIGRTLVAIFENYQQKDGSILIPEILRRYLDGQEKITVK